jgi:hypothetical protein
VQPATRHRPDTSETLESPTPVEYLLVNPSLIRSRGLACGSMQSSLSMFARGRCATVPHGTAPLGRGCQVPAFVEQKGCVGASTRNRVIMRALKKVQLGTAEVTHACLGTMVRIPTQRPLRVHELMKCILYSFCCSG